MSENNPPKPNFENPVFPMLFDGPMQMTFEHGTKEIVLKCFMIIEQGMPPVRANLRFTKEGTGNLFGGILQMVEEGLVKVTPGEKRIIQ
jgi:hypothetical protein